MAHIWPVYDGSEPTRGEPWATLPFEDIAGPLDLSPGDFISDLDTTPRFGRVTEDLSIYGFRHIIVQIDPDEAVRINWKPGYYRSPKRPAEVFDWLLQRALAPDLGEENIVRVSYEYSADSEGRPSMKVLVVLAPGAVGKLSSKKTLAAFRTVMDHLRKMGAEGTPLVQYATEEELEQAVE